MKQGFLSALLWIFIQFLQAQTPINCDIILSPNDTLVCSGSQVELKLNTQPFQGWQGFLGGSIQSGLMAYFPFNSSTADATGRNNNIQVQQVGFDVDRFGKPASAGKFAIANQSYLFVPSNANIEPASYSLSTWFKTNILQTGGLGTNNDQAIAIYTPDNWLKGPVYKHSLIVTDNSVFQTRQWTPTTSWQDLETPPGYIQANQWYHAVTTYDAITQEQRLYINGQLYSSRQSAFGYNGQLGLMIGASREQLSGEITQHFDGLLDDVALWNRPLTSTEVATLYSGAPVTVEWSTGEQSETIMVSPGVTTKYYATVTSANFTCRDSVTIQIQQIDTALKVTGNVSGCSTDAIKIGAASGYTYAWFKNGVMLQQSQSNLLDSATNGYYQVSLTSSLGCSAQSDTLFINQTSAPKAGSISGDTLACVAALVRMELKGSLGQLQWQRSDDGVNFADMKDSIAAAIAVKNANALSYYRVRVSNGEQCTPTYSSIHIIDVSPDPILPMISDTIICSPGQVLLEARVAPGNITDWYVMNADSTYQLQAAGTLALPVNVVDKTITRFLKSRNLATGCTSSQYMPVQAGLDKTPVPVISGAAAFCKGDSVLLVADRSAAYTWWLNNQVVNAKVGQSVFFNNPGNYQASLTTSNGCMKMSASKTIVQLELPKVNLDTAAGTILCDTASLFLRASGGNTYHWSLNGVNISGDSSATKRVSQPGFYQVKAIDANSCISLPSSSVNIRQQLRLKLEVTFDTTCVGVPVRLTANATGTALTALVYQWQLNGATYNGKTIGPVFNSPSNVSIRLLASTVSCPTLVDSIQKSFSVQSGLPGIRYDPVNATVNQQVQLEARTGALNYSWTPGTGLDNSGIRTPRARLSNELTYTIQLTTAGKCLTVDTLLVRVFKQVDILVPKAFTPNFDGRNDYLFPVLVGLERLIQFSVFDRWGNLLFIQRENSNRGWDGTYKGRPSPAGIYIWMAEAGAADGTIIRRNGNSMLIR